jgi:hypothetical protein
MGSLALVHQLYDSLIRRSKRRPARLPAESNFKGFQSRQAMTLQIYNGARPGFPKTKTSTTQRTKPFIEIGSTLCRHTRWIRQMTTAISHKALAGHPINRVLAGDRIWINY